jgi:hypothetical protein
LNRFLVSLNRIVSWILIALVVSLLVTGYRMIGFFSFIPRGLADSLHRVYLNVPFIILVTVHILVSIRISLMRKKKQSRVLDVVFIVAGTTFAAVFSYFALSLFFIFGR